MVTSLPAQRTSISKASTSTQPIEVNQTWDICGGLVAILLPIVMVGAIANYRKHRIKVLQRRVQQLQRIWQLESNRNFS